MCASTRARVCVCVGMWACEYVCDRASVRACETVSVRACVIMVCARKHTCERVHMSVAVGEGEERETSDTDSTSSASVRVCEHVQVTVHVRCERVSV